VRPSGIVARRLGHSAGHGPKRPTVAQHMQPPHLQRAHAVHDARATGQSSGGGAWTPAGGTPTVTTLTWQRQLRMEGRRWLTSAQVGVDDDSDVVYARPE
jgi:hypothetical protein